MVRLGLDLAPELLALACASHSGEDVPRRGCTPDPRAPPGWTSPPCRPRRTTRSTTTAREAVIRRRRPAAPVLMNCSGKHAAMLADLRRQRLGRRDLPRARPPAPAGHRRDLRRADRRAGRGGRRRRLRRAAALGVADRAGPGLPRRLGRRGTDGPRAPGRRRDPRPPGVRLRDARATSARCSPRSPARSARPAPSPATPWPCPTAGRSRSRPTTAHPRVRPVLMAAALRRSGVLDEPGVDADAVRRTGRVDAARRRRAGRRDPRLLLTC